ncbi:MAG: hypothetical protein M1833_000064 [Piccolia ochrophora]|nr:MAG: hypothetical protein M1833_000064 [Piccolia ochrophora]
MNVNKKLDRFKQWAGERMGGEIKTNTSEDFKALEDEMTCRHEGMERLHKATTVYVKSLSKTKEAEDKEKTLPVAYLGSTMIGHAEDFEPDSEFGRCMMRLGRTNERIARVQESYVANTTSNWLEGLERSLAQMKEYQAARKKLETRRLAYDASLSKMQKAKREDFRVEEELRSQKAKYEESSEDVYRRMQDIREAESESVADLGNFLDAELDYYDKCRESLLQLKRDWPAGQSSPNGRDNRRNAGSRGIATHGYDDRFDDVPAATSPEPRTTIRSTRAVSSNTRDISPRALPNNHSTTRRTSTFEGPTQLRRDSSPMGSPALTRVPTEPPVFPKTRTQLRSVNTVHASNNTFADQSDESAYTNSSPEQYNYNDRAASPATSYGSAPPSRNASSTALHMGTANTKRAPPPPPPSRAKKPPPPPPMKRGPMSTSSVPFA